MPKFALKYPFFILMISLMVMLVGIANVASMPVDLFPDIDMPVVVVATFYAGMPPQQIEADITDTFERFFTLGANIDHIQSRSLTGVSLIKVYFRPGTDPNAAVSNISSLALADLRRLPSGTLPPVVLGMTASSQPICLITLKGKGLNETQLKDYAQFAVRDQIANVPGASVPQPFGGTYRQIQVFVDPLKLEAHDMSLMDVVHAVDNSNLILPAGDVRIGTRDFNIYANSQVPTPSAINSLPLRSVGNSSVLVGDVGHAEDAGAIQTNIVRIDGQRSVYVPVLKQGGKSNTITIVNGMRAAIKKLVDVPPVLKTAVAFDQSVFVKGAIRNLLKEAGIGLLLTGIMILVFLGSGRATLAALLAIPLAVLTCLLIVNGMGGSINTMLLGGLALVLSRLIDNSVIVLENIFRFMEEGKSPEVAAADGGTEVALAVLAATFTTSIVFFPVFLLNGVSRYLFTDLAYGVVFSIFASYIFSMTLVPLFCAKFIKPHHASEHKKPSLFQRGVDRFNQGFSAMLQQYEKLAYWSLRGPWLSAAVLLGGSALVLIVFAPLLGRAYFPRTDPGQFVISVKMPSGTRIEVSNQYVARVEQVVRRTVAPHDLGMIVSNIGITPDLSSIYTPNSTMDTAFVQVSLKEDHERSSFAYINRVRAALAQQMPEISTYFQAGGLVDSVMNQGLPAPIDIQIASNHQSAAFAQAQILARKLRGLRSVSDVYIPQDLEYPGIQLNIDRERASQIGLTPKDVVDNVITALTSDGVIAPSYWIDPRTGNNYMLTVQYSNKQIGHMSMEDLENIPLHGTEVHGDTPLGNAIYSQQQDVPLHGADVQGYTPLRSVVFTKQINTPTEVDHYQLRREIDVYVQPKTEALNRINREVNRLVKSVPTANGMRVAVHGAVVSMTQSFERFGLGLVMAVMLVYLILMAQFTSFIDPFIILMAVPPGLAGVIVMLVVTGSTLNVMSLMGVIMMVGIVVSNSILIVEFAGILQAEGMTYANAVVQSCKIRLRPILMTSLATLLGMIPLALGLEAGSEQYAPLARAIIGGLAASVIVTVFLVPAVYVLVYSRRNRSQATAEGAQA